MEPNEHKRMDRSSFIFFVVLTVENIAAIADSIIPSCVPDESLASPASYVSDHVVNSFKINGLIS